MLDPIRPPCELCRESYARKKKEPPCDECMPELHPENQESWVIYSIVATQYRMGPDGPVDIDHLAVWQAIDEYGVLNRKKVFEDVILIARRVIEKTHEEIKGRTDEFGQGLRRGPKR